MLETKSQQVSELSGEVEKQKEFIRQSEPFHFPAKMLLRHSIIYIYVYNILCKLM